MESPGVIAQSPVSKESDLGPKCGFPLMSLHPTKKGVQNLYIFLSTQHMSFLEQLFTHCVLLEDLIIC